MRRIMRAPLLACVTAAVVGLGTIVAWAAQRPEPTEPVDPVVPFMMGRYQISRQEATIRMVLQDRASRLADDLDARFGEGYGGLWFDQAADGAAVVGVRPGQEQVARELAARHRVDRFRVVPVQRTLEQLNAVQKQLLDTVAGTSGMRVGGLHTPSNTVVVDVPGTQALGSDQTAALHRAFPGYLRFEVSEGQPVTAAACRVVVSQQGIWCDPPLRGGMGITDPSRDPDARCTAGFNVRSISDGKYYVLSAGHCATSGTPWQARFYGGSVHNIGETHNHVYGNAGDAMIVRVDHPEPGRWWPQPWVFVTGDGSTTRDETYDITAAGTTRVDMPVCATGRRDATECGVVSRVNFSATYRDGVRVDHLAVVAGGCIRGGDSGGPVYKNHTAYGVVSGGSFPNGDNNLCSTRWYYQGVNGALDLLRVRLVTTSNP